jgi:hypothetical protein
LPRNLSEKETSFDSPLDSIEEGVRGFKIEVTHFTAGRKEQSTANNGQLGYPLD